MSEKEVKETVTTEEKVETAEVKEKVDTAEVEKTTETVEPEVVEETVEQKMEMMQAEIDDLKAQLAAAKNDYYKAYADAENRKKRLQQDYETNMKYRIQSFALDILPVIDNFERALAVENVDENVKNYVTGFKMIYDGLMNALIKEGVEVIPAEGQAFDANVHQALMTEHVDGIEADQVLQELQKGYKLKDRVIRPSYVKVSE